MNKRILYPTLAVLFFTFTCLQCGDDCYGPYEAYIFESRATHLDNRGMDPVPLPAGAEGFLNAYGFEIYLYHGFGDTTVIAPFTDECGSYIITPQVTACKILTLTEIPGAYPAGADVSELFKYVDRNERPLQYRSLPETGAVLSKPSIPTESPFLDFLLVKPPAMQGWYQFQLVLTNADSTVASVSTSPVYLQ